jgi:choline-glycine betaine transporter
MLLVRGMGIGLLFGVFQNQFIISESSNGRRRTAEAAKEAMKYTFYTGVFMPGQFMHW